MGSRVDVKAAIEILGIGRSTLFRHVREGILPAVKIKGKLWLELEDLDALKKKGVRRPKRPADRIAAMEIRLEVLERRVIFLSYINGIDVTGLRDVTDEQLVALQREAKKFCNRPTKSIPLAEVRRWAELFLKFSEYELERLGRILQERRPWAPFYRLCLAFMSSLPSRRGFGRNDNLQELYRLLERGRKNLGQSIVITTEVLGSEIGPRALAGAIRGGSVAEVLDRYIKADPV